MKQLIRKEEYLSKIIQELKTPALAQICALESLLKTASSKFSSEETDLIKLTLNSCGYMERLIDTFSYVFKLNYSKIKLNYARFDINELLDEILSELKIILKFKNLSYEIHTDNNLTVNADKTNLKRVIYNILQISIDCAYRNSKIAIQITKNKKEFFFKIISQSNCIDTDILNELFNKYKTIPSAYSRPGTGLGLYLSSEIIHAHFGKMIAKSFDNTNILGFCLPR